MDIKEFNIDELLSSERQMDFFTAFHADGHVQDNQLPVKNELYNLPVVDGINVVWGYHILEAAAKEGMDKIYCRDLKKHNPAMREKLETALLAEGRKDCYSWVERERIYMFIKDVLSGDADDRLLALVQGGGSFIPSVVIYSSLPDYLKNLVEKGMVDLKTARNCVNIPEKAFKLIEEYFIALSFSKRRIMLVNISEIISRHSMDAKSASELAGMIMADTDPSSEAARRRYPDLSVSLKQFDAFCDENLKNTGITLKSPPWFEGDSFSVSFSFKSMKQLERITSSLERLKGKTDEIFRLL